MLHECIHTDMHTPIIARMEDLGAFIMRIDQIHTGVLHAISMNVLYCTLYIREASNL